MPNHVLKDFSPILNTAALTTIFAKTVPNLTIQDLIDLREAIQRQPITDQSQKLGDVLLDDVVPAVASVAISGDTSGAFSTGDKFTVTVHWDHPVTVSGTPRVAVAIHSNTRQASYVSGTGTATTVFQYTIVSGDSASAGQVTIATNALALNSGHINDGLNFNAATLTLPTIDASAYSVN